ncbi:hypothetical protein PG985_003249 [Apiospora marii]|uniref:uncharacterized protein n=1 Tax=Apiospora marii TaxID=335849 RepID=UPI00312F6F29
MKSAVAILSLLVAATSATPLLSARQQSITKPDTITIFSDWPTRQNVLQTIEARGEPSVTELGPPATGVCAMQYNNPDRRCRYLAWFDRDAQNPEAGVMQQDLTYTGEVPADFPAGHVLANTCMGITADVGGVTLYHPLRRFEIVCP